MVNRKARAAGDMTLGEAEYLHTVAYRIHREAGGNMFAVWALLLSIPDRDFRALRALWKLPTTDALAEAIATWSGSPHA